MDGGMYTRSIGVGLIVVSVYVDDLIIVGTPKNIERDIHKLPANVYTNDLGPVKHLLH